MSKKNGAVKSNVPRGSYFGDLFTIHSSDTKHLYVGSTKAIASNFEWSYDSSFLLLFLFQFPKNRDNFLMIQRKSSFFYCS